MNAPRQLAVSKLSPYYDEAALKAVDKVFVDGVHLPDCLAYDMDAGWAKNKINGVWQPKRQGVITVTMKQ